MKEMTKYESNRIDDSSKEIENLSKSAIFLSSYTERNLKVSKEVETVGWEFNSKSLSSGDLVFIYNTNQRNIETCFKIDKKIEATNFLWPDETEANKIIYKHRWNAKIVADKINLPLEFIQSIVPFDKERFSALLRSNFPIPLSSTNNQEKYANFRTVLLGKIQTYLPQSKSQLQIYSNYWIFIVTDHTEMNLSAENIYETRMRDKFWGLNQHTPFRAALRKGDKIIFSKGAQKFLGIAELDSNQFQLNDEQKTKMGHSLDFYKVDHGVFLTNITTWDKPKDVKHFIDKLSFIKEKDRYFSYFQGGIKKISQEEYILINEFYSSQENSEKKLGWEDQPLPMPSLVQLQQAIEKIREKLMLDDNILRQIVSSLVSGKHILLAGPIGTGKTHLAKLISEYVWKDYDGGYYPEVYTATSVWTPQDVIGGIYPKLNDNEKIIYDIQKGCVTDTVSKNWIKANPQTLRTTYEDTNGNCYRGVWLVIDEFNRANIDSAFGEMITALEHGNLKVPTNKKDLNFEKLSIPKDYRIIGTLNTFDKHYLFKLSDALKRRFAFIEMNPPYTGNENSKEEEKYYILKRSIEGLEYVDGLKEKVSLLEEKHRVDRQNTDPAILYLLDSGYEMFRFIRHTKNLGTAILISIFRFVLVDSMFVDYSESIERLDNSLDKAFTSNIIPQLEGKSKWSLEVIRSFCCEQIAEFFKNQNTQHTEFRNYEIEFRKLMKFLHKKDMEKKIERYRKNDINTADEWNEYNPWLNTKKPRLPLFKQSLLETIEESEIL